MKGKGRYHFVTRCVEACGQDINDMVDTGTEITRRTFLQYVNKAEMKAMEEELGYDRYLPMSRDWHVSYFKGTYRGVPAVWFAWSAIEHVFTLDGEVGGRRNPRRRGRGRRRGRRNNPSMFPTHKESMAYWGLDKPKKDLPPVGKLLKDLMTKYYGIAVGPNAFLCILKDNQAYPVVMMEISALLYGFPRKDQKQRMHLAYIQQVPEFKGWPAKVLHDITKLADKYKVTLDLAIQPMADLGKGPQLAGLRRFYRAFGFHPDRGSFNDLVREPGSKPSKKPWPGSPTHTFTAIPMDEDLADEMWEKDPDFEDGAPILFTHEDDWEETIYIDPHDHKSRQMDGNLIRTTKKYYIVDSKQYGGEVKLPKDRWKMFKQNPHRRGKYRPLLDEAWTYAEMKKAGGMLTPQYTKTDLARYIKKAIGTKTLGEFGLPTTIDGLKSKFTLAELRDILYRVPFSMTEAYAGAVPKQNPRGRGRRNNNQKLPEGYFKPGTKIWFEYHCWESPESGDAELWYRSQQRVTVLGPDKQSADLSEYPYSERERIEDGPQIMYRIRFSDGFEGTAWEDELLYRKKDFCRPAPPKRNNPRGRTRGGKRPLDIDGGYDPDIHDPISDRPPKGHSKKQGMLMGRLVSLEVLVNGRKKTLKPKGKYLGYLPRSRTLCVMTSPKSMNPDGLSGSVTKLHKQFHNAGPTKATRFHWPDPVGRKQDVGRIVALTYAIPKGMKSPDKKNYLWHHEFGDHGERGHGPVRGSGNYPVSLMPMLQKDQAGNLFIKRMKGNRYYVTDWLYW